MDFKVGGTCDAVTALQLDVKEPVHPDILVAALKLAKGGRNVVLNELEEQVANGLKARPMPKLTAPAVEVVKYDASRKRDLIGPGGKFFLAVAGYALHAVVVSRPVTFLSHARCIDRSCFAAARRKIFSLN